jgi:hypothetical protein
MVDIFKIPASIAPTELLPDAQTRPAKVDTPAGTAFDADTVSISPEAQELAAAQEQAPEIQWGPDLITGWKDENFLKGDGYGSGFTGAMSFTTKSGSKIGISAEKSAQGLYYLMVTVQDTNGRVYQRAINDPVLTKGEQPWLDTWSGGALCITETEDGIIFSDGGQGTDGDDIIINGGRHFSCGGAGDDIIIHLKQGGVINGEDGDDTLVDLTSSGVRIYGEAGDDAIYTRNYTGDHYIDPGTGSNTIIIDNMARHSWLEANGSINGEAVDNTYNIGVARGFIHVRGGSNSFNIGTFTGDFYASDKLDPRDQLVYTSLHVDKANSATVSISGQYDLHVRNSRDSTYSLLGAQGTATATIDNGIGNMALGSVTIRNGEDNLVTNNTRLFYFALHRGLYATLNMLKEFGESTVLSHFAGEPVDKKV